MRGALPLNVKHIKQQNDKNVNIEVNSNDMDSHGIKYHVQVISTSKIDVNNDKYVSRRNLLNMW